MDNTDGTIKLTNSSIPPLEKEREEQHRALGPSIGLPHCDYSAATSLHTNNNGTIIVSNITKILGNAGHVHAYEWSPYALKALQYNLHQNGIDGDGGRVAVARASATQPWS